MLSVKLMRLRPEADADIPLPRYMTAKSAGMDMHAAVKDAVVLKPGDIVMIPSGFAMALPQDLEAQIRPRSGLAVKHGITLVNSPGTIDADYRGEVKLPVINLGNREYAIKRGDRIAQMVVNKIRRVRWEQVNELDYTDRNAGGFGHTGV